MSKNKQLPAVHLSLDELEGLEELLRENTSNCEIEIVLTLPGGVEERFESVDHIDTTVFANVTGSDAYTLSVIGDEGRCTIGGESTKSESHMIYCTGDPDWRDTIQCRVKQYLYSVQSIGSWLREPLAGKRATAVAVFGALFVGWAIADILLSNNWRCTYFCSRYICPAARSVSKLGASVRLDRIQSVPSNERKNKRSGHVCGSYYNFHPDTQVVDGTGTTFTIEV